MLFYWTRSQLSVITPCGTSAVVPLRRVVGRCGFLALRVGVYCHQCVGSSGGGVVSVPWGCNEAVVYRPLPYMCWFSHHGGVVDAPSVGGVWLMLLWCAWL